MIMACSASTSRDTLACLPVPLPPIDPLDVFLELERRLPSPAGKRKAAAADAAARDDDQIGPHFVPPCILAYRDTLPATYNFARHVNTGFLGDEQLAAIFVAVRLFGERWRGFVPRVSNRRWAESIDSYRKRSVHGQQRPCPAEMLEIMRLFRMFLRPSDLVLAHHSRHIAPVIKRARTFVADAFGAKSKSDSYRVSLFLCACRLSDQLTAAIRSNFVSFVAQNSFIRRRDASELKSIIDCESEVCVDEKSIVLALGAFRCPAR